MTSVDPATVTEQRGKRGYINIVQSFLASGERAVRLEDYDFHPRVMYSGLGIAIKRHEVHGVKVVMRDGEIYLVRVS